jgi:hypothetical protein
VTRDSWTPWRRLACLGLVAAAALASGCAATVPAQVTTFHQLPARDALAGRRFVLAATAEQQASLEHASYAERVRAALVRQGLVEAPQAGGADCTVTMRHSSAAVPAAWGEGPGSSIGVGVSGGGFSLGGLGVGIGVGFPIGRPRAPATRYRHEFEVAIDCRRDGSAAGANATGPDAGAARLFEGRAVAESDSASIAPVAPALVDALFEGFPGPSGGTRAVEVPLPRP